MLGHLLILTRPARIKRKIVPSSWLRVELDTERIKDKANATRNTANGSTPSNAAKARTKDSTFVAGQLQA